MVVAVRGMILGRMINGILDMVKKDAGEGHRDDYRDPLRLP